MIDIIYLSKTEIHTNMLINFQHQQVIKRKWVLNKSWELVECSDLREWSLKKRKWIIKYLREQIEHGGTVIAAFDESILVGFCCIDGYLRGRTAKYMNLTMLFVDDRWKRKGIGERLFKEICEFALKMEAEKVFISAIPSYETIAFYFHMGCEDAKEIIPEYVDTENDRYLEYPLT